MILEKVLETDNGYILIGKFHSINLPDGAQGFGITPWPKVTDADGQEVSFTTPVDIELDEDDLSAQVFSWAIEIDGKQFNWPLTIAFQSLNAYYPDAQTEFEFATGPNPQMGQVWDLNLDLEIAGYPLRVVSATRTEDGYDFAFEGESWIRYVDVTIAGTTPKAGRGGGQDSDGKGHFISSAGRYEEIPSGKLTIILNNPAIEFPGTWQLQWQPDDAFPGTNLPEQ